MLVATAGHIDHGKTSLVRALTGVETDRLPEERARGISIDLGFAYWTVAPGTTIGFVDVPGHERFVRNMLAGVGAVDFALLVVAADDGVMPQTVEHAQILELLGVARGAVVVSKCDRVSQDRIDVVTDQVCTLLAATPLASAPVFCVSTLSGAGIAELSKHLRQSALAGAVPVREGRNFRLPVDRVFSVAGSGTIVTGTVHDGTIGLGSRLCLSARGQEVRVRGIQCAGRDVERASAGERCALNLTGMEAGAVKRGDWLLVPAMQTPAARIEVVLKLLRTESTPLKHFTPVHLHIGTAALAARVLLDGQGTLASGEEALVQLLLEKPFCTVSGDRFVIRDQSARRSIGGGRVTDPVGAGERRASPIRRAVSAAMQFVQPTVVLRALLAIPDYETDTMRFERAFNLDPEYAAALYRQAGAVLLGRVRPVAIPATRVSEIAECVVETLRRFHQRSPDSIGMDSRSVKASAAPALSPASFLDILRDVIDRGSVEARGALLKLPGHTARRSPADRALWERLRPLLEDNGLRAPSAAELALELRTGEAGLKTLLYRRREEGEVWRITAERFMTRQRVAQLAASAAQLARSTGGQGFSAAQFRDAIGSGRTLAIQILEFFDSVGVTRRQADLRKMQPDYELVVGSAAPLAPHPPAEAEKPQGSGRAKPGAAPSGRAR